MAGTFASLHYHLVFSTKDRRPLIDAEIRERLFDYLGGIVRAATAPKGGPVRVGGVADHVHLLARCPPTLAVSDLMRIVKSKSSGWVHETFPDRAAFAWQEGYGAFTVSRSDVAKVADYIARQAEHHAKRDFKQEFRRFLKAHEIEYDEETIWL